MFLNHLYGGMEEPEEKQRVLLPIDGARERRLAALKAYNPSRGLIEWAAELRRDVRKRPCG
jgi:hypothetical protein